MISSIIAHGFDGNVYALKIYFNDKLDKERTSLIVKGGTKELSIFIERESERGVNEKDAMTTDE